MRLAQARSRCSLEAPGYCHPGENSRKGWAVGRVGADARHGQHRGRHQVTGKYGITVRESFLHLESMTEEKEYL